MLATISLLGSFFPPDLSMAYLALLIGPILQTLGMAFAAMTLAFLCGLPLAIAAAIRVRGTTALVTALALLRAIPDLTLAIVCVILFGIGTGAGMIALFLFYTATVAKVFTDLLETAPSRPIEALAATGASPPQIALYGLVPLTAGDLISYGAFAFECCLRSSIIVGAVGGGGIGTELVGSLAAFDFHRASTLVLVLLTVIGVLDRLALWLRVHPAWLVALVPFGLTAAWLCTPAFFAFHHTLQVLGEMAPTLDSQAVAKLPELIWQTVWMSLAGTFGAAALGLIAALAASRKVSPWLLRSIIRKVLELFRTIPELVWGLVLVAVAGIGPAAGAWALGVHSFGSFGRLFADAIDNAPVEPQWAIASTGASPLSVAFYATLPLAGSAMATHLLFRLEWNMRMATAMGLIGGGGIGQALYEAQQLFFYGQVLAYMLITAGLVLVTDHVSSRLRMWLSGARVSRPRTACMRRSLRQLCHHIAGSSDCHRHPR